ncbi:hypothetical protein [Lacrimispora indolis]|nr:hypothetical protein [Lacrimispora indolis]
MQLHHWINLRGREDEGNTKRASDTYKNEPPEKKNQGLGKDTGPAAIHK